MAPVSQVKPVPTTPTGRVRGDLVGVGVGRGERRGSGVGVAPGGRLSPGAGVLPGSGSKVGKTWV